MPSSKTCHCARLGRNWISRTRGGSGLRQLQRQVQRAESSYIRAGCNDDAKAGPAAQLAVPGAGARRARPARAGRQHGAERRYRRGGGAAARGDPAGDGALRLRRALARRMSTAAIAAACSSGCSAGSPRTGSAPAAFAATSSTRMAITTRCGRCACARPTGSAGRSAIRRWWTMWLTMPSNAAPCARGSMSTSTTTIIRGRNRRRWSTSSVSRTPSLPSAFRFRTEFDTAKQVHVHAGPGRHRGGAELRRQYAGHGDVPRRGVPAAAARPAPRHAGRNAGGGNAGSRGGCDLCRYSAPRRRPPAPGEPAAASAGGGTGRRPRKSGS